MIGFIYVSDIPKFIIMMAIAIALVLIWVPALAYFFPHGGTAAGWLALAALAGTFSFSWWAGTAIWDRIDTWLYWRKLQRIEARKETIRSVGRNLGQFVHKSKRTTFRDGKP